MSKIVLLIMGVVFGIAITLGTQVVKKRASFVTQESNSIPRYVLVNSSIDALDLIHDGDTATAELVLASAVDAQINVVRKMKSSSEKEMTLAEEWSHRMEPHNARLQIKLPVKKGD